MNIIISLTYTFIFTMYFKLFSILVAKLSDYDITGRKSNFASIVFSIIIFIGINSSPAVCDNCAMNTILEIIIISLLVVIALVDYAYEEIPNELILVGLTINILRYITLHGLTNSLLYPAIIMVFYLALFVFSSSIGGGDVKLAFLMALSASEQNFSLLLFLPFAYAAVFALIIKAFKRIDKLPFAPFMVLAYVTIWITEVILNA